MAAALQFQLRRLEAMQQTGSALVEMDRLGQDFFARGEPERFGYNSQTTYDINLFELLNAYDHAHRSNIRTLHIQPSGLYSPSDAVKWLKNMVGTAPDWQDLSKFLPEELKAISLAVPCWHRRSRSPDDQDGRSNPTAEVLALL